MRNTEILRNHYINLLSMKINAKGGRAEKPSAEAVFANIQLLAKEQVQFGDEKTYWLDINTKKMLARIIDPDVRLEYNVVERTKTDLAIEARLYWSDSETPAGIGFVKRSLSQMVTNDKNAEQIEVEFEALVRGAAATRALTDAGIGLEFYSDGFDTLFNQLEGTEAEQQLERQLQGKKEQFDKAVPPIPSAEELKAGKIKGKADKKTKEKEAEKTVDPKTEPTTPLPEETAIKEESNPTPVEDVSTHESDDTTTSQAETSVGMTVDEAKMQIADIGNYAGQPLGLIFEANPRNLVWLVKNGSAVADAARVIAETDERLAKHL